MELTKKQIILIAAVSGAILLLTVAAILIFTPGDESVVPEPTYTPLKTVEPTFIPTPAPTLSPTVFRLPLVPQWDTPRPTASPMGAGVFAPNAAQPTGTAGPWVGAGDEHTQDILAVGLRDGRAAALLLLRLSEDAITVLALPAGEAPLAGESLSEQGERAWTLAEAATGRDGGAWMALDLGCLPAVLQVTGPLGDRGMEALSGSEEQRAEGAVALAMGAVSYARRASLLQFPAIRRAIGDAFASNLSARELWRLLWTVRSGIAVCGAPLPGKEA